MIPPDQTNLNLEKIIQRILSSQIEYEWAGDSLKIWGKLIKKDESVVQALARNLAQSLERHVTVK